MRRKLFAVLLLPLAACQDTPTRLLAPEGANFVQVAANLVVNSPDDVVDDQGCDDTHCSLREAIAFASPDATITFDVTGPITLGGSQLVIDRNLTITGPGATSLTVSGNNASRVFLIAGGTTVSMSGLTISGGKEEYAHGGGIVNYGTLTLTNSTVSGNNAVRGTGGGIYNDGTLTLTSVTVSGNSGIHGGGIRNGNGGTLTLTNSTVLGNSATDRGGFGGGISNVAAWMMLQNSTVSGNTASRFGGGIYNLGIGTLQNSTVSGNTAGSAGGGINQGSAGAFPGTLTLQNSIVANNLSGGNCGGTIIDGGYNLDSGSSCGFSTENNSLSDTNPRLGPLADNGGPTKTHALLPGSPAINAGDPAFNSTTLPYDQRGVGYDRVIGGRVDIGAFEVQVIVIDVVPPELILPSNMIVNATGPAGAVVTYAVSATDDLDPTPVVICSPISGSFFAIGTTRVNCSATDAWENESTGFFDVTVLGAADQLENLISLSAGTPGVSRGTQAKLLEARDHLSKGQIRPACNKLKEYIDDVRSQSGKKISPADAAALIQGAQQVRSVLDC